MSKKRTHGTGWSLVSSSPSSASQEPAALPPEKQRVQLTLEKRKKGKVVTVVGNLALSTDELKDLAKSLKIACGTGGTARNAAVELQGDCQNRVRDWLKTNGWGLR